MRVDSGRKAARTDRHAKTFSVPPLDLGFAGDGLVDGYVDEVKRAAVLVRHIRVEPYVITGNQISHAVILARPALRVRGPEVRAREPGAVHLLQRRKVHEAERPAENP